MKVIYRVSLAAILLSGLVGFLSALLIQDLYDESEYDGPLAK